MQAHPADPPASFRQFLGRHGRWVAVGYLLALASSFGQTFFIGVFAEHFRAAFDLSFSAFGGLYMTATLLSAATLVFLGPLADRWPPRRLALALLGAFSLVCLAAASVSSALMLGAAIYGLRLCGQGMLSHLSQTVIARWFTASRGRALGIAAFGYPTGEAIAPILGATAIALIGWRETWAVAAGILALGFAPLLWILLRDAPEIVERRASPAAASGRGGREWSRAEALRDPVFWALAPSILSPGFMITVVFFLPNHIAEIKEWAVTDVTATYPVFAVVSVLAAALVGPLIDRTSARACLPYYLLPMMGGLALLSVISAPEALFPAMGLLGLSAGAAATVHGAIWAEIYGARHLGAIKALGHAAMVLSSALGPGLVGVALDAGIGFERFCLLMAAYLAVVSIGNFPLSAWLRR